MSLSEEGKKTCQTCRFWVKPAIRGLDETKRNECTEHLEHESRIVVMYAYSPRGLEFGVYTLIRDDEIDHPVSHKVQAVVTTPADFFCDSWQLRDKQEC